jgi:hypothetical protein
VQASIPDSQGVIHACYLKSGGTVNVIDSSTSSCTSKQLLFALCGAGIGCALFVWSAGRK